MSFKVTPEVSRHLQEFADRITPPTPTAGAVPGKGLTAAALTEQYGITTDKAGQPLKPGQIYIVKDAPAVNHHRRLCKAYEQGGYPAVERYLQPYRTPEAIARDAASAAAAVDQAAADEAGIAEGRQARRVCGAEAGAVCCPCTEPCHA